MSRRYHYILLYINVLVSLTSYDTIGLDFSLTHVL